jgi:hypothetical protein
VLCARAEHSVRLVVARRIMLVGVTGQCIASSLRIEGGVITLMLSDAVFLICAGHIRLNIGSTRLNRLGDAPISTKPC